MKKLIKVLPVLLVVLCLSACGYESSEASAPGKVATVKSSSKSSSVEENEFTIDSSVDSILSNTTSGSNGNVAHISSTASNIYTDDVNDISLSKEKIIYSGDITLSVENFEDSIKELEKIVDEYDGIIENSSYINNLDTNYYVQQSKAYNIRVKSENFKEFSVAAESVGVVLDSSSDAQNITQEYADKNATLKVYEQKLAKYEDLLEQATTVDEILRVENEIYDTQADIDKLNTRIRNMNTDTAYSYVYITVEQLNPDYSKNPSFSREMGKVIVSSLKSFIIMILYGFPYIILAIAIISSIVITRKKIKKLNNNNQENK